MAKTLAFLTFRPKVFPGLRLRRSGKYDTMSDMERQMTAGGGLNVEDSEVLYRSGRCPA